MADRSLVRAGCGWLVVHDHNRNRYRRSVAEMASRADARERVPPLEGVFWRVKLLLDRASIAALILKNALFSARISPRSHGEEFAVGVPLRPKV